MPLLRLIIAGLVAFFAMAAVLFTAAVVLFTGMVGWVAQRLGVRPATRGRARPGPRAGASMRSGDVIDVEATPVPDDTAGR